VPKERGESMNRKKIGLKLQELRGEKPRKEVAEDLGIGLSTLRMYENGERNPRDEIKFKIAQYYNVSVADIFFGQ
jgi:putative transcriptional regulator